MRKPVWAEEALTRLQAGLPTEVTPRGHSMKGRINDGETVTLQPCAPADLVAGDIVLARVQGRRYSHLVLHLVLDREENRFLIGNNLGRIDGWVGAENVFGKVTRVATES